MLGDTRHVEGRQPDLVCLTGLLGAEEVLTRVQPPQQIAVGFGMCIGKWRWLLVGSRRVDDGGCRRQVGGG